MKFYILEVRDGTPELMKYISDDELCELCEVFDNALTGSGGTVSSGVKAVLSKLDVEIIQQPQGNTLRTSLRG